MTVELDRLKAVLSNRYTIERELGRGGMAIVYLATDLRHRRRVAVKVLHPELSATVGAQRFLREIETAARLSHPHILPLYDSGQAEGVFYYVMPHVEGESLRDLLERERQIGLEETLEIVESVAAALDYAHDRGVIHRDVKPANILFQGGQALVADFGIAVAVSAAGGRRLTETAFPVGTPAYMSPEQAMGHRDLDPRSDVYSLGAMVYEMLVGEPPHVGTSAQAVIAKILSETPMPIRRIRELIPSNVEAAVQRALARSPGDRFRSAGEFSAALTDPSFALPATTSATEHRPIKRSWKRLGIGAAVATVPAAALAAWMWAWGEPPSGVSRSYVAFPLEEALLPSWGQSVALSPEGANLAYIGPFEEGTAVWVKARGELRARRLAATQGAFQVGFDASGEHLVVLVKQGEGEAVLRVPLAGGPPTPWVKRRYIGAVSWGSDGFLYAGTGSELLRIPEEGGELEVLLRAKDLDGWIPYAHTPYVHALPRGRGVLFTVLGFMGEWRDAEIGVLDLRTGEHRMLMPGAGAWYTETGHLLVLRADGTLFGVPFDLDALTVDGVPVPLLDDVATFGAFDPERGMFDLDISANGTLVYLSAGPTNTGRQRGEVVWISRSGVIMPLDPGWRFDLALGPALSLSPDGTRLLLTLRAEASDDIWIKQLPDGPLTRLTFNPAEDIRPHWSSDGQLVLYLSCHELDGEPGGTPVCDLYETRPDGAGDARLVLALGEGIWDAAPSEGSEWLLLRVGTPETERGSRDVLALRPGADSTVVPILTTEFEETAPALSPDGRWLAYQSDESGRWEIFVRPFPSTDDGKWQISADGGVTPLWAHSGRELFYLTPENEMVSVAVDAGSRFTVGDSEVLFELSEDYVPSYGGLLAAFDISPDDQRFVMMRTVDDPLPPPQLVMVDNWFEELREKAKK